MKNVDFTGSLSYLKHGIERWLTPDKPASSLSFRNLKAACEIGYFISSAGMAADAELHHAASNMMRSISQVSDLRTLISENMQYSNLLVPLALSCRDFGWLDPDALDDTFLQTIANSQNEKIPFRHIDLLHCLWKMSGKDVYRRQLVLIAEHGCLRRSADRMRHRPEDDYAVTHTIFYVTDFGRIPLCDDFISRTALTEILDSITTRCIIEGNLDILAEVSICRHYIGDVGDDAPLAERELQILADGYDASRRRWPGPVHCGSSPLLQTKPHDADEHDFFENYHTTLVAFHAVSLAQGRSRSLSAKGLPVVAARSLSPTSEQLSPLVRSLRSLFTGPILPLDRQELVRMAEDSSEITLLAMWFFWRRTLADRDPDEDVLHPIVDHVRTHPDQCPSRLRRIHALLVGRLPGSMLGSEPSVRDRAFAHDDPLARWKGRSGGARLTETIADELCDEEIHHALMTGPRESHLITAFIAALHQGGFHVQAIEMSTIYGMTTGMEIHISQSRDHRKRVAVEIARGLATRQRTDSDSGRTAMPLAQSSGT